MTQKQFCLLALDQIKQQIADAERCMENDEYWNAITYITGAQHSLATATIHLFISRENPL